MLTSSCANIATRRDCGGDPAAAAAVREGGLWRWGKDIDGAAPWVTGKCSRASRPDTGPVPLLADPDPETWPQAEGGI